MKIAFISVMEGAPWGGSEELWSKTAAYAAEQGHQVMVSVFERSAAHPKILGLQEQGASVFCRKQPGFEPDPVVTPLRTASKPKPGVWIRALQRIKWVIIPQAPSPKLAPAIPQAPRNSALNAIRSFRPDIICVSQGGCYDLAYMRLGNFLCEYDTPFFVFCHSYDEINFPSEQQREEVIRLFKKARQVFMVAKHQMATVERQLAQRFSNFHQIQNPINLSQTGILPFPSSEIIRFANVASLDVIWKGQDLLLEALSQPDWKARSWHLNLYGLGKDQSYLEKLSRLYGIAERVTFKGYASNVRTIWEDNHLLISPSRIDSGPMTIREAMLCGRPVVATAVGLSREQIEDGKTGFIAEAATLPLLLNALDKVWQRKADWSDMGTHGYYRAIKQTDHNSHINLLARIIAYSKEQPSETQ